MESGTIQKQLHPLLQAKFEEQISRYIEPLQTKISSLQVRLDELRKILNSTTDDIEVASAFHTFYSQISELAHHTADLHPAEEVVPQLSQIREQLAAAIHKFPEWVEKTVPVNFWSWQTTDRARMRLSKSRMYVEHPIRYLRYKFKKDKNAVTPLPRRIPLWGILEKELSLPFSQQLLVDLDIFARLQARALLKIQNSMMQLKTRQLSARDEEDPVEMSEELETVSSQLIEENGRIVQFKNDASDRWSNLKTDLGAVLDDIWDQAGTPLQPARHYSANKVAAAWKRLNKSIEKKYTRWHAHTSAYLEDWQKDLELALLQFQSVILNLKTQHEINEKVKSKITPQIQKISNLLNEAKEKIETVSRDELNEIIQQQSQSLLKELRQNFIPELVKGIYSAELEPIFGKYRDQFNASIKDLSHSHSIVTDYDIDATDPKLKTRDIALKELVSGEIGLKANRDLDRLLTKVNAEVEYFSRNISTLDQVIEYNYDTARDLLGEKTPESGAAGLQIAVKGLERTRNILSDLDSRFNESLTASSSIITSGTSEIIEALNRLADNEKILDLNLRLARTRTREKLIQLNQRLWRGIKDLLPGFLRLIKKYFDILKASYFRVRKISGLEKISTDADLLVSQYLIDLDYKIKSMPYIYRRLFEVRPLTESRFFIGRSDLLSEIQNQHAQFKNDYPQTLAIVGEKGVGKTTLLNFALRDTFSDAAVVQFDITTTILDAAGLLKIIGAGLNGSHCKDLLELQNLILQEKTKRVVIMENIQNLFLREINGFELMERLMSLISATSENVFWILSCGLYSWNYLDAVIQISKYFKRIITIDGLTRTDLEEAILSRHRVTGFLMQFTVPEEFTRQKKFRKLKGETEIQEYLHEKFMSKMHEESGGNIRTALMYWLRAIHEFGDEEIKMNLDFALDDAFLYKLQEEELYIMGALIQHEFLTSEKLARVLRFDPQSSALKLSRMLNRGYFSRSGDQFFIHPLFYRNIVKVLQSKHIIF